VCTERWRRSEVVSSVREYDAMTRSGVGAIPCVAIVKGYRSQNEQRLRSTAEATVSEHPTEAELVGLAFADSGSSVVLEALPRHLAQCTVCHGVVDTLRAQANTLRLVSPPVMDASPNCLEGISIAALAGGSIDPEAAPAALRHLLDCPRCRQEVASVARLLEAPEVAREVDRLEKVLRRRYWRRVVSSVIVGGVAAAGLLVMLDRAPSSKVAKPLYREEGVTGAVAPRLIAPLGAGVALDAFRWTSVPRADRYRITVFARDGSVIWEASTRDTTIMPPDPVRRISTDTVLWRVAAHVGWEDRWATSDLAMLAMHRPRR
jgi:hypothetical protein